MVYFTRLALASFLLSFFMGTLSAQDTAPLALPETQIYDFNEQRDLENIVHLFEKNNYWLFRDSKVSLTQHQEFLKNTSFTTVPYKENPKFSFEDRSRSYSNYRTYLKVAYANSEFIGFVVYKLMDDRSESEIVMLAVEEKFQKKGFGKQLLNFVITDLAEQGATCIIALTFADNALAIKLFNNNDFLPVPKHDFIDTAVHSLFIKLLPNCTAEEKNMWLASIGKA
jgi:ribosomal protein S18 acetylase RimI-like enzyme